MTEPMKILISLLYYLPHRTGLSIHVQQVAEALTARGHSVTVLASRHAPDLPRDEIVNGVRIVRLWTPPIHMSRGMIMPFYPIGLYHLLREHDLIFINTPMLETGIVAVVAGLLGKPVVATHHGDLVLPTHSLSNRVIEWIMLRFFQYMARRASRLIGYSRDYAENSYYLKPFLDKVTTIYPPITIPEPDLAQAAIRRAEWQIDGGPLIAYSGRFVDEKRPDLLIRSLETINKRYPNARIVFAGQYKIPYENTWEKLQGLVNQYTDQLLFLGFVTDRQALANFYAACDVMVLPSDTECFALVQVDAMLSGTPVVMTDTPGGRVPVRETGMGKLVPRNDPQAIGQAVLEILDDPMRYTKTRAQIAQIFSLTETIDHYEAQFEQAIVLSRQKRVRTQAARPPLHKSSGDI